MHAFPPAALTASPRAESACAVGTLAFHTQKHETCDRRCAATYCSAAPGSRMPNCWYAAMRRILWHQSWRQRPSNYGPRRSPWSIAAMGTAIDCPREVTSGQTTFKLLRSPARLRAGGCSSRPRAGGKRTRLSRHGRPQNREPRPVRRAGATVMSEVSVMLAVQ